LKPRIRGPGRQLAQLLADRGQAGPRADADQHALLAGGAAGHLLGILGLDGDHAVEHVRVQIVGDEAGGQALDRVRTRLAAGDHRRQGRLDRIDLQLRPFLLQHLPAGGDVAAGADAGDQHVDRAVAEVVQDLLGGGAGMDLDIGRIVELLRHPAARRRFDQLLRAGDRALHPLLLRRQVEARAISEHQPAPLEAHALRHDQDELVALHRGDHGEADAGIARGRLDDRAAGLQLAAPLGLLDHRQRDAVLDRAAGIGALGLDPDLGVAEQAVHADMRRVADRLEDVGGFHGFAPAIAPRRAGLELQSCLAPISP
jgi:hypothetical protein